MYGRGKSRVKKIVRKWGLFMSAILKQKLIDIANGFTKYGLWKGGGSGGSSALSDMTDVSFSNLKENNILKYNGSMWINSDNLHEYSTEEKIVGKWIDGKTIYEKVIKQTIVINSQKYVFNIDIPKYDFIMYYVDMVRDNTNEHNQLNFTQYDTNYGIGGFVNYINNSTINLRVGSKIVGRTYHLTMIFRYTKAE